MAYLREMRIRLIRYHFCRWDNTSDIRQCFENIPVACYKMRLLIRESSTPRYELQKQQSNTSRSKTADSSGHVEMNGRLGTYRSPQPTARSPLWESPSWHTWTCHATPLPLMVLICLSNAAHSPSITKHLLQWVSSTKFMEPLLLQWDVLLDAACLSFSGAPSTSAGIATTILDHTGAACSVVVKLLDLDPQGRWFDPRCGHDKICTAVGPLSEALNPTSLQGGFVSCLQSNQL